MNKEEIINKLPRLLVSIYGKIWALEHPPKNLCKNTLTGLCYGLINPVLGFGALAAMTYADEKQHEEDSIKLKAEIKNQITSLVLLAKKAYPSEEPFDAALLAITDVSLFHGDQRIHDLNVAKFPSNGWGGNVLVSDACNTVISIIHSYLEQNMELK